MFTWFKKIGNFVALVGFLLKVLEFVRLITKAFEVPGLGPEKKEAVLKVAGYAIDNGIIPLGKVSRDMVLALVGTLVDLVIAIRKLRPASPVVVQAESNKAVEAIASKFLQAGSDSAVRAVNALRDDLRAKAGLTGGIKL